MDTTTKFWENVFDRASSNEMAFHQPKYTGLQVKDLNGHAGSFLGRYIFGALDERDRLGRTDSDSMVYLIALGHLGLDCPHTKPWIRKEEYGDRADFCKHCDLMFVPMATSQTVK